MYLSNHIPLVFWLGTLFLRLATAQTAYESIFTLDAFALQQTCVQDCFTQGYANIACYTDVLGSELGCPNTPCSSTFAAVDGCYCRGDLQNVAHDILSSCIDQSCTIGDNGVNLATAASIYSGYCSARGFKAMPASNSAATTSSPGGGVAAAATTTASNGVVQTSASSRGATDTSSPSSSSSGSSSNTLTIALASVIGVAVIAILALGLTCWHTRRKKRKGKPAQPDPDSSGPFSVSTELLPPSVRPVMPNDSASQLGGFSYSQVGQPGMMGQAYPNYQDGSMVASNVGRSMMGGGGRNMSSHYGGPWR